LGGLEGRRKSHSDRKKLKFLTNKNERENGDFRKYAKDKNYPAHFRKKCIFRSIGNLIPLETG